MTRIRIRTEISDTTFTVVMSVMIVLAFLGTMVFPHIYPLIVGK